MLIGNNTKLDGGGFRGKLTQSQAPGRTLRPLNTELLHIPTTEEPQAGDFLSPNGTNVVMYEGLPGDEKARDHIKAMVVRGKNNHNLLTLLTMCLKIDYLECVPSTTTGRRGTRCQVWNTYAGEYTFPSLIVWLDIEFCVNK